MNVNDWIDAFMKPHRLRLLRELDKIGERIPNNNSTSFKHRGFIHYGSRAEYISPRQLPMDLVADVEPLIDESKQLSRDVIYIKAILNNLVIFRSTNLLKAVMPMRIADDWFLGDEVFDESQIQSFKETHHKGIELLGHYALLSELYGDWK